MPYLADRSYLGLEVETIEGTAVRPNKFVPLVSESILTNPNYVADRRFMGLDWKSDDLSKGSRSHEGDLVIWADPDNLGHFLNMILKKGTTTGDATDGYVHPFTVDSPKTYTIEMGKGNYAQRFFGVKGEKIKLDFVDGKLQATLTIKAMGQVSVGTLSAALTGAGMTSLTLKQDYDLTPNNGFVIGDVITVGGVDITLTGVNVNGITLEFASTTVTASIGDPVRLKAQTPSYAGLVDPLYQGNALVGFGADETEATTNAGAKATATAMYEFSVEKINNLLSTPATGSVDPVQLLPQTRESVLTISQLFENETQHQSWLDRIKQAITLIVKGKIIGAGVERLTWKAYKVKLTTNAEPLEVGSYLFDKQSFESLYDSVAAKAIWVELVNHKPGTDYE